MINELMKFGVYLKVTGMKLKRDDVYLFSAVYLNWGMIYGIISGISIILFKQVEAWLVLFNKGVLISFLGVAFFLVLKRKRGFIVLIIGSVWGGLSCLTLLITPEFFKLFPKTIFYTMYNVIIPIFLISDLEDYDKLERSFIPFIYIGIIYSVIQWKVFTITGLYSMDYSYHTIMVAILSLVLGIYKKKISFLIIAAGFFGVNLLCGSRGSLVCYMIAIIFVFVIFVDFWKRVMGLTLIVSSIVCIFNFWQRIMSWLSAYFIKSRTISLLAEGNFFYASGREKYYSFVLKQIRNAPMKIRGIYSDRIYIGKYFHRTDLAEIFGSYSHNFFLEILFQFGLWGILLLICYGIVVIYSIYKVKKYGSMSMKIMYIMFASYAIGQLLISGSYLTSMSFGIFTGFLFSVCGKKTEYYVHKKKYRLRLFRN